MKQNEDTRPWTENDEEGESEMNSNKDQTEPAFDAEHGLPDAEIEEQDPMVRMEIELSEYKDKFLRLYSEFENYKKRVSKERIEQIKYANIDTYLTILPVIDDFERAQKSLDEANDLDSIKQGIQLIYQKLKSATESKGLKPMVSIGNTFDPDFHDAISSVPASSEGMKGKVIDEIEKGYLLNDRVVRHAKVIVGN
jgi:molecular chaperone GrpE